MKSDENLQTARNPAEFLEILRTERNELINVLRKTRFSTLKPGYPHSQVIPYATYSPWVCDIEFLNIYEVARAHTLIDIYRCYELYSLAKQQASIEGDLVEVGVWRGGSAAILASAMPLKTAHLFDTFEGVVKADSRFDTLYEGGEHSDASTQQVTALFDSLSISCAIHVGIFPEDTLSDLPEKISLAHIDVDTNASAKESFDKIWPRVVVSGVVIFDDYGAFGCEGVTQFVSETIRDTADALMVHNLNGHALLIKR